MTPDLIRVPDWAAPPPRDATPRAPAERIEASLPAAPPAERRVEPAERPTENRDAWAFVLPDGTRVDALGPGVIGRNPSGPASGAPVIRIALGTAHPSVSKTHLSFGREGDRLWIADRGSTNGTRLRRHAAGGEVGGEVACPAGERVDVAPGDTVLLGDAAVLVVRDSGAS